MFYTFISVQEFHVIYKKLGQKQIMSCYGNIFLMFYKPWANIHYQIFDPRKDNSIYPTEQIPLKGGNNHNLYTKRVVPEVCVFSFISHLLFA